MMKAISPTQYDFLKEMASISMGSAATGLATLLGKKISITNPDVRCLALEKVVDYVGKAEQMACSLLLKIMGDINGSIMLVFPNDVFIKLLKLWFNPEEPLTLPLNEFYESALKELGNITISAYLTALNNLTNHVFRCTPPLLAIDMLGSMLEETLCETAVDDDYLFVFDTEFIIEEQAINGFILLIMSPHNMEKVFANFKLT